MKDCNHRWGPVMEFLGRLTKTCKRCGTSKEVPC